MMLYYFISVVVITISVLFALWIFASYLQFKRDQEKHEVASPRFAIIRAKVRYEGTHQPKNPEDFTADDLFRVLSASQMTNLADVPREWIAGAAELGAGPGQRDVKREVSE